MSPNLLLKTAFVRGDLASGEKPGHQRKCIRTDFILQNIFRHSLKKVYSFDAVQAINDREDYVLKELKDIFDSLLSASGDAIRELCLQVEVTEDTVGSVVQGVSNELFCEGITWSRIVSLFAFTGELTLQCLSKKVPDEIVNGIYECLCRVVKETLISWVEDHGGWEGLTTLSLMQQGNINSNEPAKPSNSSWAMSFLHGTVQVIGTLAHIANSTNHVLP